MNYEEIKDQAAIHGVKVDDLLALSTGNDPFYVGKPSQIRDAQWFAQMWERFGYTSGVHLRRVHYQLVSQNPRVELPLTLSWRVNGQRYSTETYINEDRCWAWLNNAGKYARYLGYVSPDSFVDRRNPSPLIHTPEWGGAYQSQPQVLNRHSFHDHAIPYPSLMGMLRNLPEYPDAAVDLYEVEQGVHVEVWAEKTTMNDVLIPLCQDYQVNLVTGAGEMSITACWDFINRARAANKPSRILYISDYDPAGLGMPISVARKVEFFHRETEFSHLDIKLEPIVLTREQVAQYELPRVPVKDSDRRKANFEEYHGEGQVELDAMEALYPGELAEITRQAILQYYDEELVERAERQRDNLQGHLDQLRREVVSEFEHQLADARRWWRDIRQRFEEMRKAFLIHIKPFDHAFDELDAQRDEWVQHTQAIYREIEQELEDRVRRVNTEHEDFVLPRPELPDEGEEQLYASHRSYMEQNEYYHHYRNGTNGK